MTQKAVKEQLVEAYNRDTRNELNGVVTTYANDLLMAVQELYINGIVNVRFLKNIFDFYFDGEMERRAVAKEPTLYKKLYAKGVITK